MTSRGALKDVYSIDHSLRPNADSPAGDQDISRDERDLAKFGKKPRFERRFGFLSITGITCALMLTWESQLTAYGPQLANGGPAGLFIGMIVSFVGTMLQVLVMAEVASMVPLSGGQYNWVAVLAPPKWSNFLSYFTGWLTMTSWLASVALLFYVNGLLILELAQVSYANYTHTRWHVTLVMYAIALYSVTCNVFLGKFFAKVEAAILLLHIFGFFVVLIALFTLTPEKQPASEIFGNFINSGNWSSNGLSFMVGLVSSALAFQGNDAAAHLSEEVSHASTVVPWSMIITVLINGVMGVAMTLAVLFCSGPIEKVVEEYVNGGLPFAVVFQHATGSASGTIGLGITTGLVGIFGCIGVVTSSSRMVWAFARENGLPGSRWLAKVQPVGKHNIIPLNAIILTITVLVLLALINIGSDVAFNAFAGLEVQGYYSVFLIVGSISLRHRLSPTLQARIPWGPFRLGRLGVPITILALAWTSIAFFFSFWPPTVNPAIEQVNWAVVCYGGVLVIAAVNWVVSARKTYQGPLIERTVIPSHIE